MRKIFAGLLALVLLVSQVPSVAYAVEGESGDFVVIQEETESEGAGQGQEETVSEKEGGRAEQEANVLEETGKEPEQGADASEETEKEPGQGADASEGTEKEPEQGVSAPEESEREPGQEEILPEAAETEQDAELPKEDVNTADEENQEALPDGTAEEEIEETADEIETDIKEAGVYASQDFIEYPATGGNIYINSDGYIVKSDAFVREVIIPESVDGKKVNGIAHGAFMGCNALRKVTVTGELSAVGGNAFDGCISLEEICFTQGVATIGEYALRRCKSLETVIFSGKTNVIGYEAFAECTGLREMELPEGLQSIGGGAFADCGNLQKVVIPAGVTAMGKGCFKNCGSLTEVTLPQSVVEVGWDAFYNCTGLRKATIMGNLTSLGWEAFRFCKSLEMVQFSGSVAEIGTRAFANCTGLKEIALPKGLSSTGAGTFAGCSNLQSVVIPSGVKVIDGSCFSGCSSLSEINFPESVTIIDGYAFSECKKLSELTLPRNLVEVRNNAFDGCTGLREVTAVGRLSLVGYRTFASCTSLEKINFTQGVAQIHDRAFIECQNLTTIYMLDKIATVGRDAFYNCSALSDVYYYGTEQDWQNIQIDETGNQSLLQATIHYNYDPGFHTVTFDMQGHGIPIEPYVNINPGIKIMLPEPVEEGYLFDGWYTQEKGAGEKAVSPFAVTKNITLYANWIAEQPLVCTVTFDMQGHGTAIAPYTGIAVGSTIELPQSPTAEGYQFEGWYTRTGDVEERFTSQTVVTQDIILYAKWIEDKDKPGEDKPGGDQPVEGAGDVLPEDMPADGKIPGGLWIAAIEDATYTGMAVQPDVHVYDGNVRLREGTDYKIGYKNNINAAGSIGSNAPTVIVNGKGNYSGRETAAFAILQVDISGSAVYAANVQVKIGSKVQKPVPELYYMGTKLVNDKDFTVSYENTSGVYAVAGTYNATVAGKGNYSGTRKVVFTAAGSVEKAQTANIAKAQLSGFQKTFGYTGQPCIQQCTLTVKMPGGGSRKLTEGTDYTVLYTNNKKVGKATVTYCGINGFTGKLKKTYKIRPYHIQEDDKRRIRYDALEACAYAKGGSKPKPVIYFDGVRIKEGADYTLSYKNNKSVGGGTPPTVVVSGKGSFKGKLEIPFTIKSQDLSKMTLVSGDKVYKNKANIYKITPKLMDLDGKMLSAGKDFDKNSIVYTYEKSVNLENGITKKAGDLVEATDIIPADTQIRITLNKGSGSNYSGSFSGVYKIAKASINSAKITIPGQVYTGKEIKPDSQIVVKVSGKVLGMEDYEIVGYRDNINKGKATVMIKGKGNYGGIKTAKFTIGTKGFLWWR